MTDLLATLLGGIAAIVAVFFILYRLFRFRGAMAATAVALLVLGIYGPISIVDWPGADVFAIHLAIYMVTAYLLGIITSYREKRLAAEGAEADGRWFHWGPTTIILFFLVVISVDAVFVTVAQRGISSDMASWLLPEPRHAERVQSFFPGTVARDYQEKEELYNQYLAQVKEQQRRGWEVEKGWVVTPVADRPEMFRVAVTTRDGEPVAGAEVTGRFLRPSNAREDRDFAMGEIEPGVYQARLSLPEPGRWNLVLQIRHGEDLHEVHALTEVRAAP